MAHFLFVKMVGFEQNRCMNLLFVFYFVIILFSILIIGGLKRNHFPSISFLFCLALLLQALIPTLYLYYLKDFERFTIDKGIIQQIMWAYVLFMCIATVFLFLLLVFNKFFKYQEDVEYEGISFSVQPLFVYFIGLLAVLQFGIQVMDGDIVFLFKTMFSGKTSGDDYSLIRLNLIEEGFDKYQTSSIFNYIKYFISSGIIFGYFLLVFICAETKGFFLRFLPINLLVFFDMFILSFKGFEKGPILLFLGITFAILYKRKIAGFGVARSLVLLVFANIMVTMVVGFTTGLSFMDAFVFMYFRIFVEPSVCTYMHFSVFPSDIDFVNFSNMGIFRNLFNLNQVLVSGSIPIDVAQTFTGLYYSANANIVPMGWAQSGYVGVFVYAVITMLAFLFVDIHTMLRGQRHVNKLLIYFYLYFFLYFANTSIENFMFSSFFFFWPVILPYITINKYSTVQ